MDSEKSCIYSEKSANAHIMKAMFCLLYCCGCFFAFGFCFTVPKENYPGLPCWLVRGSGFYVCSDLGDRYAPVLEEPNEKSIQPDYFKSVAEQSEYAPFSNHDSSSFGDWLLSAINRAMSDIQKSADEKRKFDSIGHKGMFGFGK